VGANSRNVELLTDSLAGYEVTPATEPADLDPLFAGAVAVDLVVVDTESVDDGVTALVERLLDDDLEVLLMAGESTPRLRESAATTEGLTFREKPLRATDLRETVERVLA
jgi:DNA-binding NtrC family response regulator